MNLDTFFEKFELFADAPNAVAKMRELILDLAVRGKLVPQDPSEEDSQDGPLANLGQQMEIDKRGDLPEIPSSWHWMSLGDLGETNIGLTYSPQNINERGVPVLRSNNIQRGKIQFDDLVRVNVDIRDKCIISNGDLLICARNGSSALVGKSAIVSGLSEKTAFGAFMAVFRSNFNDYISIYLRSWLFRRTISSVSTTTINQITQSNLKSAQIPLPPLAEQKRIVAKVDELMALCDRLEAQQQQRETRHTALAQASLTRFADAPTPANLELLFHKAYTIEPGELRKSILTLAVQGKLVPQDSRDEPAESIIRETELFFQRMVAAKRLSAPKPLPPIDIDHTLFALPYGWCWCRFGNLIRISSGDGLTAKQMNDGEFEVYGGNGVTGHHDQCNVEKPTLVIGRVGFYCGSVHITPKRAWVTDNAFITTFNEDQMSMHFLYWLLTATDLRERDNATAQPVISGGKIYPIVLGIPPLAEQKRIVAKVEQLMGLVDRLEAQLAESRATATALLEAVVAELSAAA